MRGKSVQWARSRSSCDGKEQFTSYTLADGIASKRSRHGKKNHVYRCGWCHKFHLGSATGGKLQRRDEVLLDDDLGFA